MKFISPIKSTLSVRGRRLEYEILQLEIETKFEVVLCKETIGLKSFNNYFR